jgi:predicted secreted Zn-dependent protease
MADVTHAVWRKSSYSSGNGGACVEVARNLPNIVAVRDSKNPEETALVFTQQEWRAFLDGVRADEFSL